MDRAAGAVDSGQADLREFDGDAGLGAEGCTGARAGAVAPRLGHCRDASCEHCSHGLGHGLIGAAVAEWPAVALVGSYELLAVIIHGTPMPAVAPSGHGDGFVADPLGERAVGSQQSAPRH